MVAVYHNDAVTHWILVLALFHLGAVSCSAHPNFDPMPSGLPVDVYITERMTPFMSSRPVLLIEQTWLRNCVDLAGQAGVAAAGRGSDPCRVIASSGTTGEPKAIALSYDVIDKRLRHSLVITPAQGPLLCMMTMGTFGGFTIAYRARAAGVPVFFAYTPSAVIRSLAAGGVTELTASPAQLAGLVRQMAGRTVRLPSLHSIVTGGAPIPAALLARARATLCANVVGVYGSTEAGTSARAPAHMLERYPGCAGYIEPGVEVQIVDEAHQPVAPGQEGVVRVRSGSVAAEFMGDPAGTAKAFRDGWFYPGDLGVFKTEGVLVITGRETEVINIGGSKINPALIDEFLASQPSVVDAAAFGVAAQDGVEQVWAAVVVGSGVNQERLLRVCREQFGNRGPARIFQVAEIPRNAMGKIQRSDLRALCVTDA